MTRELPVVEVSEVAGSSYAAKPSRLSRKPSAWYRVGNLKQKPGEDVRGWSWSGKPVEQTKKLEPKKASSAFEGSCLIFSFCG